VPHYLLLKAHLKWRSSFSVFLIRASHSIIRLSIFLCHKEEFRYSFVSCVVSILTFRFFPRYSPFLWTKKACYLGCVTRYSRCFLFIGSVGVYY